MLENLFFILGIVNNLFLTFIFLIRNKIAVLQRIGWIYFLLAIPAAYGIFLAVKEHKAVQYSIFLGIFLAFLAIEGLYDYILKINFRKNWKLLIPYLILYYAMSYGFVVMVWENSFNAWSYNAYSCYCPNNSEYKHPSPCEQKKCTI